MRRRLAAAALAFPAGLMVLLVATSSGAHAAPKDHPVEMTTVSGKQVFKPAGLTVTVGDSVTWRNSDPGPLVTHNITSSSSNWSKNQDVTSIGPPTSFTFKAAGTYTYFCRFHGTKTTGMRGSVTVVKPATATTPPPTKSPSPRPSTTPAPQPSTSSPRPVPPPTTSSPAPTSGSVGGPPIGFPSVDNSTSTPPPNPKPTVALPGDEGEESANPAPSARIVTGSGPQPPSHRGRNTLVALAVVLLGGLAWAEVRALLATPAHARPQL